MADYNSSYTGMLIVVIISLGTHLSNGKILDVVSQSS